MIDILIRPDAPDLPKKAEEYFLVNYNEVCAEHHRRLAEASAPQPAVPTDQGPSFSLSIDDYPESAIDSENVRYLLTKRHELNEYLSTPIMPAHDGREAARLVLHRRLRWLARAYLDRVIWLLLFDERLHPESPCQLDARHIVDPDAGEMKNRLDSLPKLAYLCNLVHSDRSVNAAFADELTELFFAGELFFDVFDSVFNLSAIRKCRTAFNLLVRELGTVNGLGQEANYFRRQKTMFRELLKWKENGGVPTKRDIDETLAKHVGEHLAAVETAVAANTRTVANMDRRQKTFLAWQKKIIGGFTKLFRPTPKIPAPSREQVAAALLPKKDRYACLTHTKEPHRSQIIMVIDYTANHPIVWHEQKKTDFTLSKAAQAVWEANEENWSKVPGTFGTFDQLKAACYHLKKKKEDDPFTYAQENAGRASPCIGA